MRKRANAFIEYGVVLTVVVLALSAIQYVMGRQIKARVKAESDRQLSHGQGLEWALSFSSSKSESFYTRKETPGAKFDIDVNSKSTSVTYYPPIPPYIMEHKGSSMSVQDAPSLPPVESPPPAYPATSAIIDNEYRPVGGPNEPASPSGS